MPDKLLERPMIERRAVIAKMTANLGAERTPNRHQSSPVPDGARPLTDSLERRAQSRAARLDLRDRVPVTRTAPIKGEPQKVKGRTTTGSGLRSRKRDDPGFLIVQMQTESLQSVP